MFYLIHRITKEHRVVPHLDILPNADWRYIEADADGWIEWQAEALSEMIAAIPFSEELAREMLRRRRDELQQQAEGGEA